MARASQTTQQIVRTGLNPSLTAPDVSPNGDVFDAGDTALWVDNASAGAVTVTVQATVAQDGLNLEDLVVSVPAGEVRMIGPFPARTFAQPAGASESGGDDQGRVYADYSAVASVTRAVIAL